ncbi:MAG TPA: GGDEF domain-containing protein [Gammaproteobacteria bacterium]|nr:GGDEF domain-containing protein [Gammaproteobacteria bacterium]
MSETELQAIETTGVQKVLRLLEAVRRSPTGAVIYNQVERMLQDVLDSRKATEQVYITLINQLLTAYIGHLREGSPLHMQVRLLQVRLQPPLAAGDLAALQDYIDRYATHIAALAELDSDLFRQAVEPLLAAFGIAGQAQPEAESPDTDQERSGTAATEAAEAIETETPSETGVTEETGLTEPGPAADDWTPEEAAEEPESDRPDWRDTATAEEVPDADDDTAPLAEAAAATDPRHNKADTQVDTVYRSHLDSKRRDIQKLQSTLAEQVLGTIAQNEEFGVLLEVVLGELRQAGDGRELEDLRWTLVREIEKLTKAHHELAEKLDSTHHYLQIIESDSRQLSDELTRVRLLSLTDELTGLPNRRAFLRRIEDEVARVQRYGFPLSLALMDLDHFKQVNDKYGHAGGDEVLQIYSRNILSIFRHHDLVARYGGEEFAVLLPNTDEEGSMRALTKVRGRALETRWQANGDMIPVPSFSAGVSLYKPGETASAFIERADKALYRAKRLGRNRVEMDATYRNEPEDAGTTTAAGERQRGES